MSQDTPARVTSQDWEYYEQTTRGFVASDFGDVLYRVFASKLHPEIKPEVLLYTYSGTDRSHSPMLPGFLSADAAEELANALKAAVKKVRALEAQTITEGGSE